MAEKGLFDKLFGKKESKEELEEAARKAAEEAKRKAELAAEEAKREAEVAAENAKRVADAARYKAEGEARRIAAEAKKAKEAAEAEAKREEHAAKLKAEIEARLEAKKAAAFIGEHTVTADDTLSHIALKFYGKATPPYYKLIYEANKDIIGDNMNVIVPGQVLQIPALPEDLK